MNIQRVVTALTLVTSATVLACGGPRQLHLTISPDLPSTEATVKVSATKNGNTKLDLVVRHLALPQRVTPGATVYMVWVRGNEGGAQPQSLGALRVNANLEGSLSTVTPLTAFDLFITAETSQSTTFPLGKPLLYTTVSMK